MNIIRKFSLDENISKVFSINQKLLGYVSFLNLGVFQFSNKFSEIVKFATHKVNKSKDFVVIEYEKSTGDVFFFKESKDYFQHYNIQLQD